MTTVRLTLEETEGSMLPSICMRCGAPATVWLRHRFALRPAWALLFLPVGGPVGVLIYAEIVAKRMTVRTPLCFAHQHHWLKRTIFNFAYSVPVACLFVVAMVPHLWRRYFPNLTKGQLDERLFLTFVALAGLWVLITAALDAAMILPDKIDKVSITLRNVHPSFDHALALMRDKS